ncbi:DUF1524 domain-containing protein [Streptomyces sp. NPDC102437]|uniref:GmrSD restriction endonuclease domain-containing protein n=1 Tax=Streptomyces sp. NPDC102437 TaxID=3366175 RepID=UPI003813F047
MNIDHIVPLKEAWRSGASEWSTPERRALANGLTDSQLIAVSAASNQSKGDKDPAILHLQPRLDQRESHLPPHRQPRRGQRPVRDVSAARHSAGRDQRLGKHRLGSPGACLRAG